MPAWITHLTIADLILQKMPLLNRRGFCVGSIAPDCNVENEYFTAFTPPREVTHWMSGRKKAASDGETFLREYVISRREAIRSEEEFSFLLGYYAHLAADAEMQIFWRDRNRLRAVWDRIRADELLGPISNSLPETWDTVKQLISKEERLLDIQSIESEYLQQNPDSGYLTEILPLKAFPDYIDYLPPGCIVRKIGVMGKLPSPCREKRRFIALSEEEYSSYIHRCAEMIVSNLKEHDIMP